MRAIRDMSIRYKITLLLLSVVSIVLLAVSVANVIGEVQSTKTSLATRYSTLARIVAAQSGAALSIADIDASAAQEIVADLAAEPSIEYAALVNNANKEVARYQSSTANWQHPDLTNSAATTFTSDGFLDVVQDVHLNDATFVGRVYLRVSTAQLRTQVRRTVVVAIAVYVLALLVAFLLSYVLQHLISTPILQLAQLMRRVSDEHNYSLSAEHVGNDELGELCKGFNAMLAEIRRRDDELMRSNDELKQFAFVASHDLQEPLRSITSFCNMLQAECKDQLSHEADNYLERIIGGAKRMKALVTELLNYSRVSRSDEIEFEKVDISDVLKEAIANLQGSIDDSGAEIFCGELPCVAGDRGQLVQVVQNLIGNSIIYRGPRPPQITVEATPKYKHWVISVRDNGIGIAPEHYERIFEIFKRLHNRSKYPGTGIGLAVCRKIIERHRGKIWVESQPDQGSAFHFTLPVYLEESTNEQQQLCAANV